MALRAMPTMHMNIANIKKRDTKEYPNRVIRLKNRFIDPSKIPVFFLSFHCIKSHTMERLLEAPSDWLTFRREISTELEYGSRWLHWKLNVYKSKQLILFISITKRLNQWAEKVRAQSEDSRTLITKPMARRVKSHTYLTPWAIALSLANRYNKLWHTAYVMESTIEKGASETSP